MSQGQRRLAAIMFTDIVGYTALTQANEQLAMELLEKHRELIRPIFLKHSGREVKSIGDAFLVEFGSALEASECAVEIQKALHEYNESARVKALVRVGIHLGDVIYKDNDVYGDAVNVASRIEPLASGGGICISEQVYDQIRNKVPYKLTKMQAKGLKNVVFQIDVYRLELPWEEGTKQQAGYGKHRLAILPFVNISPDPADEYFADGTTEEMISTLSNINDLIVISRTSVMQYKGAKKNLADIGKELGADTMLEGSVRKAGNRVRITVQLLDALEDRHLWAQSYDRELEDVFAVQSDIARRVGEALKVKLLAKEVNQIQKKPTDNTEAYLLYLKGRQHWNKRSEDSVRKAVEYFHLALDSDPDFALADVGLADSYNVLGDHGYITPAEASAKSRPAVLKALELDGSLAEAHTSYAWGLATYDWNWDSAEEEYRKAIELNSNYASAHQWYSLLLKQEGRLEEALVEIRKALELDPLAPMMSNNMGSLLYCLERYEDAITYYNRSLAIKQDFVPSFWGMGLTYAMKEEFDQATFWQEKLARLSSQKADAFVGVAAIQARAGKTDQALRTLDSATTLQNSGRIPATSFAYFFAAMHDEDKAFEWMKKSVEEHEIGIPYTKTDPWFKELRDRPRFLEILKMLGLDKY